MARDSSEIADLSDSDEPNLNRSRRRVIDGFDVEKAKQFLKQRIKGQDHVIDLVCGTLARQLDTAKPQEEHSSEGARRAPLAAFFCIGPTGTGKTLLAHFIPELLFGDASKIVGIDCTSLSSAQEFWLLSGVTPGHVGSDRPGLLTGFVAANPGCVVLFDHVERGHPDLFRLVMQILDEGQMLDRTLGNVVDFTSTVIVMTSNLCASKLGELAESCTGRDLDHAIRGEFAATGLFPPEFIVRVDNYVAFRSLDALAQEAIALIEIKALAALIGLGVEWCAPELIADVLQAVHGSGSVSARDVESEVKSRFFDLLLGGRKAGLRRVQIHCDAAGEPCLHAVSEQSP